LKVDSEKKPTSCQSFNAINTISFDATPNATSMVGNLKNQAVNNPAQNINVELILFNSNWTQQHTVDLQSKEAIDFNKIPGWTKDKEAQKVNQLNFAVRYTKDASTLEEVTPGEFYVVLPFMLKFN
jgi:type 1 fimbria pilin